MEIHGVLGRPSLHTSPWCAPFAASSFMLDLVVPRLWNSSSEKYSHLIKPWNTKYEGKTQLTRHSSFIRQWILVVRSICIVIPCCARHAASSIAGDYQPFNIITYWYSLSSYNFPALYQLNIFLTRPTGLKGHPSIRDSTLTSCQGVVKLTNFGTLFLGHHYFIQSFSYLCWGVETIFIKEIMHFHHKGLGLQDLSTDKVQLQ